MVSGTRVPAGTVIESAGTAGLFSCVTGAARDVSCGEPSLSCAETMIVAALRNATSRTVAALMCPPTMMRFSGTPLNAFKGQKSRSLDFPWSYTGISDRAGLQLHLFMRTSRLEGARLEAVPLQSRGASAKRLPQSFSAACLPDLRKD